MFSATIDNILCFLVFIRWKRIIYLELAAFFISEDPPTTLILNFSQLKLRTFFMFRRPASPYLDPFPAFPVFLVWKASLTLGTKLLFGTGTF